MRKRFLAVGISLMMLVSVIFPTDADAASLATAGMAVAGMNADSEEAAGTEAAGAVIAETDADSADAAAVSAQEAGRAEQPAGGLEDFTVIDIDLPEEDADRVGASEAEEGETAEDSVSLYSAAYLSEWDQYSTNFFYNQLTAQEKAWWDDLDALGRQYLAGTTAATAYSYQESAANTAVQTAYRTEAVAFEGISAARATEILYLFRYSNPQYYFFHTLFFRQTNADGTSGKIWLTLYPAFAEGAARAAATEEIKEKIDEWALQVAAEETDLAKEQRAHDLICESVSYDQNYLNDNRNEYNQSIYSVFCTDSTVCAGYSQAMMLLMNGAGIDCGAVTSIGHEWNLIRLNDTWYYLDLTWDDLDEEGTGKQSCRYTYFNRSMDYLLANDSNSSHEVLSYWEPLLPESSKDSGATRISIGSIYMPQETMTAPRIYFRAGEVWMESPMGGSIYYTTDGTQPSVASGKASKYTESFSAEDQDAEILAIAVQDSFWDSQVSDELEIIETFQVDFHSNGGSSVDSQIVDVNAAAERPADPSKSGYSFRGWYEDEALASAYDFSSPVTKDLSLYAKWQAVFYTVSFDSRGGSQVAAQSVQAGERAERPADPVREGYQFGGWHLDIGGSQSYDFGSAVSANLILYAKWTSAASPAAYTVQFETSGGTSVPSQTVSEGECAQAPGDPLKAGYRFGGWCGDSGCSSVYNFAKPVTGDLTLYARWQGKSCKVKLDANGGYIGKKSVRSKTISATYGQAFGSLPEAKRKGYAFLGWYTKKTGGRRILSSEKSSLTGAAAFYARWGRVKARKVSISSTKSTESGRITVRIKGNGAASGYEVRYSRSASMASSRTLRTEVAMANIAKLKKGGKYYVQVRMYQKESVSGKITCGPWSGRKRVTVKK